MKYSKSGAILYLCHCIYNRNKDYLFLVDESHPLAEGYSFEHHTLNCGLDIDKRIYNDFSEMLNACNMAGYEYNIIILVRTKMLVFLLIELIQT